MRRVLAAALAALVLWAPLADARALVVVAAFSGGSSSELGNPAENASYRSMGESVISIFRSMGLKQGVDYDVMAADSRAARTEFFRRGAVTYGFQTGLAETPGAVVKTYDAVIHVGLKNTASGTLYRPDSLMGRQSTTTYNRVPQVFIWYGSLSCAACSTGYGGDVTYMGSMGQVNRSGKDNSLRFRTAVNKVASLQTAGHLLGGYRVLIGASSGAGIIANQGVDGIGADPLIPAVWPDSLITGASDSAVVWAKLWQHLIDAGVDAKPTIYVQSNDYAASATNIAAIWTALAWADSLTGGGVFPSGQATAAINIRGGFSRGGQLGWPTSTGGMTNTDSTNFKATLDSLNALGVPITVAANPDSVASYPNEKEWWSRIGGISYSPWFPTGLLDSTSAGNQATSRNKLVDIYGLRRTRVAIGNTTGTADTSIASLLRVAFARCDSLWPYRVDRAVIAPLDDWSPRNISAMGQDSLLWAFHKAGARAVVSNRSIAFAQAGKPATTQQGASWQTDRIRLTYAPGEVVKLLSTATLDSGSVRFDSGTGQVGQAGAMRTFTFIEQWWRGFVGQRNDPTYAASGPTSGNGGATDSVYTRTPVLTVYASDLQSGLRADASTLPLRPGFHLIKEIVNASKVVNSYARRPLIRWVKTEDVQP